MHRLSEATDKRKEYAAQLRSLAAEVEAAADQPSAAIVILHWQGTDQVTAAQKFEAGANMFTICGHLGTMCHAIMQQATIARQQLPDV